MADEVHISETRREKPHAPEGDGAQGITPKTYRRPPSPAEQERRKAWGTKWGQLRSESMRELRKDW